jgi:hypothetical protein
MILNRLSADEFIMATISLYLDVRPLASFGGRPLTGPHSAPQPVPHDPPAVERVRFPAAQSHEVPLMVPHSIQRD